MAIPTHIHHHIIERFEKTEDVYHDLGVVAGWSVPRSGDVLILPGVEHHLLVGSSRWNATNEGLMHVETFVRPLR